MNLGMMMPYLGPVLDRTRREREARAREEREIEEDRGRGAFGEDQEMYVGSGVSQEPAFWSTPPASGPNGPISTFRQLGNRLAQPQPCPGGCSSVGVHQEPAGADPNYRYDSCPEENNIAIRNLPPPGPALDQIRAYQQLPANDVISRCIFAAQRGAGDHRLIYCSGNQWSFQRGRKCVSPELHRMVSHALRDGAACLGIRPQAVFQLLLQESSFMPNARNTGSTAHGIGQYIMGTLRGNGRNFAALRAQFASRPSPECDRVLRVFHQIPAGVDDRATTCESVSRPQSMLSNLFYALVDHANFRRDFGRILEEAGAPASERERMEEMMAYLGHHDGPGGARAKLCAYLGSIPTRGDVTGGNPSGFCRGSGNVRGRAVGATAESMWQALEGIGRGMGPSHNYLVALRTTRDRFSRTSGGLGCFP